MSEISFLSHCIYYFINVMQMLLLFSRHKTIYLYIFQHTYKIVKNKQKKNALLYLLQLALNHYSVQTFNMSSLYKTGIFSKIKQTIAIEMKYYDQNFPIIHKLFHILSALIMILNSIHT